VAFAFQMAVVSPSAVVIVVGVAVRSQSAQSFGDGVNQVLAMIIPFAMVSVAMVMGLGLSLAVGAWWVYRGIVVVLLSNVTCGRSFIVSTASGSSVLVRSLAWIRVGVSV
jgi:hypothetical protein